MNKQLYSLWRSSSLIQGTMALTALGAVIYMAVIGEPIPDVLVGVVGTIIGFYFGTKNQQQSGS